MINRPTLRSTLYCCALGVHVYLYKYCCRTCRLCEFREFSVVEVLCIREISLFYVDIYTV